MKIYGEEINFLSNPLVAGKASLSENAFYHSHLLSTANFSPELRYPVQLIYKSNSTSTGIFGYAWHSPQLESRAVPQKDGVEWKTPWGETVRFFSKQMTDKDTLALYKDEIKGSRAYFAPYSDWDADGKIGDWTFTGKRDMKGWTFAYRNAQLVRVTSPSNRSLLFNYVNNGQIKSVTQDNKTFLEFVYDKDLIREVKINGLSYRLAYRNCDIPVLPETLEGEFVSIKKNILASYAVGDLAPVEFSYANGFLAKIKQNDLVDALKVETESFADRMSYLTEVAACREAKKDVTKIERQKINGRLISDSVFSYQYPENKAGKINLINKLNEIAKYDYDTEKGIYSVTGVNGLQTKTYFYKRYDVAYNGDIRQIVDGKDRVLVNYRYDKSSGKMTQIRDASLNEFYLSYDEHGNLVLVEKRASNEAKKLPVAKFAHDSKNNPTSIMPLNEDGGVAFTVRQSFNNNNQLSTRDDGQVSTRYAYNDFGYVKEIANELNLSKTFRYDQYNRLSSVINPNGVEVAYTYNNSGLLTRLDSFFSISSKNIIRSIEIEYDKRGLPLAYTDHKGRTTRYERDSFGRVISEFFADDTKNHYDYDLLGRVVKVLDPNQNEITFSWNKHGLSTQMTAEKQVRFFNYDKAGLLENTVSSFQTGKTVRSISYGYDELDRPELVSYGESGNVSYKYDAWGKMVSKIVDDGKQTRELILDYDYFGRTAKSVETTKVDGKLIETLENSYTYNPWGQRLSRRTVKKSPAMDEHLNASWKYDKYGRLIESKESDNAVTYLYNAQGQVAKRTVNGFDTFYSYTGLGYLETKQFGGSVGGKNADAILRYFYDADGTLSGRESNGERFTYQYDLKGQLLAVVNHKGEKVEQYAYDPVGNILSKTIDGKTTKFTYDRANQLASKTDSAGKVSRYVYDGAGRLVKEGNTEYNYGWLDKVVSISEGGHKAKAYDYDAWGQLARTSDLHENTAEDFIWDGLALIKRGNVKYLNERAITGGTPIVAGNKILFEDMLGNSIGVKDNDSVVVFNRDAFGSMKSLEGNSVASVESNMNYFDFFTGKPSVEGLGYNFAFRNYRSELGKWQTHDPKGYPDGWNNLAYCNNWATIAVDPFGTALNVVGTPEFQQQVQNALNQIKQTETGRNMIQQLENSSKNHTIQQGETSQSTAANPANAGNASRGSDTTIDWNPDQTTADGWTSPDWGVLGHELVHTADADNGTLDTRTDSSTGIKNSEIRACELTNKMLLENGADRSDLRTTYGGKKLPPRAIPE